MLRGSRSVPRGPPTDESEEPDSPAGNCSAQPRRGSVRRCRVVRERNIPNGLSRRAANGPSGSTGDPTVEDPESSPVVIASDQTGTTNVWLRSVILGLLAVVGVAVLLRAANLAVALATRAGPDYGFSLSSLPIAPEIVDKIVWAGSLSCAGVLLMLALFAGGRAYLERPIRSVLPPNDRGHRPLLGHLMGRAL